ncbi:MAG: hypothetical protein IJT01_13580 [Selenomonadaceae bacterium]|nr:hypothetical protein [Selenomonadaceae bacterium]
MKCYRCGCELNEEGMCSNCGPERQVRVMSQEEKVSYDGITIEESSNGERGESPRFYKKSAFDGNGIRFRHIVLDTGSRGWLGWLIGGLAVAAVLAFVFLVALPIVLVLAAVAAVVWFLLSLLRGY